MWFAFRVRPDRTRAGFARYAWPCPKASPARGRVAPKPPCAAAGGLPRCLSLARAANSTRSPREANSTRSPRERRPRRYADKAEPAAFKVYSSRLEGVEGCFGVRGRVHITHALAAAALDASKAEFNARTGEAIALRAQLEAMDLVAVEHLAADANRELEAAAWPRRVPRRICTRARAPCRRSAA